MIRSFVRSFLWSARLFIGAVRFSFNRTIFTSYFGIKSLALLKNTNTVVGLGTNSFYSILLFFDTLYSISWFGSWGIKLVLLLLNLRLVQSRSQSLRSPWPAVGKRELWEQPFWSNKGNNRILPIRFHSVCIYGACLKWLLPELSIPTVGQKDRGLWGRECVQGIAIRPPRAHARWRLNRQQ